MGWESDKLVSQTEGGDENGAVGSGERLDSKRRRQGSAGQNRVLANDAQERPSCCAVGPVIKRVRVTGDVWPGVDGAMSTKVNRSSPICSWHVDVEVSGIGKLDVASLPQPPAFFPFLFFLFLFTPIINSLAVKHGQVSR